jgi:capsular exopolysaccharide synthesis family protein
MDMDKSLEPQMEKSLDLRYYFSIFLQKWWLILIVTLVAGAANFFISSRMTPIYQSSTTVLVNEAPGTKSVDYTSVLMSKQLTSTYSLMMANDLVLRKAADQIGLANPLEEIKKWITVTPVRDTQIIQVTVDTTNPELSSKIANAVVAGFAVQIQDIQTQRFVQSKATLEMQIADTEKQISTFSMQADEAINADEKNRLDAKVTQYREIYSNLLLSYEQVRLSEAQAVSSVVQVEPATPNLTPVKPKVMQNTLLAALVGFLIAIGIIVILEAIDDTIKNPEELNRKFNTPILGVIARHDIVEGRPISEAEPRSPVAESFRALRTNVNFASVDAPLRRIVITSPTPSDGKSTIAANLAVVIAQSEKKVVLIDADMRRPKIHIFFGLANRFGLSDMFLQPIEKIGDALQSTNSTRLAVITSGSLPPNPSELLTSQRMGMIFEKLLQGFDTILIDTPPILSVTDAAALAQGVDGVILVIKPGTTKMSAFRLSINTLRTVKANILGVVLNEVNPTNRRYGYYYNHYYMNGYNE